MCSSRTRHQYEAACMRGRARARRLLTYVRTHLRTYSHAYLLTYVLTHVRTVYSADEPERGAALGRIAQLTETTDPATHSERQWEIHAWLQAADAHMHLYREGSQQGLAHSKDSQRGFTYLQGQRVPPSLHPPMPLHPGTPARAPVGGARRRRATRGAAQCRARCRVRRPRREDGEPRGPHRGRGRARHLAACAAADIG